MKLPTLLLLFVALLLTGCSPPSSTVVLSKKEEANKAVHDVLDGPDAKVRIEVNGIGALFVITKKGDSVTVEFPDHKAAEKSTSVANLRIDMAKGELEGCKSNLKNIATACEMWSTDYQGRYPKKLSSLTPNYLKTIPFCPHSYSDTYSATYKRKSDPDFYSFFCEGDNHKAAGLADNFPQYNSEVGLTSE